MNVTRTEPVDSESVAGGRHGGSRVRSVPPVRTLDGRASRASRRKRQWGGPHDPGVGRPRWPPPRLRPPDRARCRRRRLLRSSPPRRALQRAGPAHRAGPQTGTSATGDVPAAHDTATPDTATRDTAARDTAAPDDNAGRASTGFAAGIAGSARARPGNFASERQDHSGPGRDLTRLARRTGPRPGLLAAGQRPPQQPRARGAARADEAHAAQGRALTSVPGSLR